MLQSGTNLLFAAYVIAFAGAGLVCLIGAWRAASIDVLGVRRGLIGLLGTSAGWSIFTLAYVAGPALGVGPLGQRWFYGLGLVVGFATVLAWLYLCFALAGWGLHRSREARGVGLGILVLVTATKITNPLHGLYFTVAAVTKPFPHLAIDHHSLFWISLGGSYTLAAIGYFVLYDFLSRTQGSTGPLVALFGLMGLPALLNMVGYASPVLLDISHEPLGVAAFAVGVLFIYWDQFQEVSLIGRHEGPALAVGAGGRVRAYNQAAADLFPALTEAGTEHARLAEALPDLSEALESGAPLAVGDGLGRQYYRAHASSLGRGSGDGGTLIRLSEVTEKQQRWRLEEARREGVAESLPGLEFQYRAAPEDRPAYRHVGTRAEEVLGLSSEPEGFEERFLARVPEEYHQQYWTCTEGGAVEGQISRVELPFNRPDGEQIWLLLTSRAEHEQVPGKGEELVLSGIMLDITERKRARAQASLQTEVLRKVAEGDPLEETLTTLVEGLEALCPGMLGSVLLYDQREDNLRHGAAPSLPGEYVRAVDGLPIGPNEGSCGTAAYSGELVVAVDIETDPRWESYRDLALRHKLRAAWSAPIKGSEGKVLGTFAMYYREPRAPSEMDLTLIDEAKSLARIAIEKRQNTNRLRLLSESLAQSTEAVLITAAEHLAPPGPEILYVNEAFEEMTGYDRKEIVGETPRVLQGPETEREVLDSLRVALEDGEPWEGETINYRKDGTPYQVRWKTAPVRGEDGEIQYWTALQRDVTQRRLREQALRERESQLRSITENVSDAIYRSTEEEGIVYANQAFLDLFGYESQDELAEIPPDTLYADPEIRDELYRKEEAEGELSGEEVRFQRKDGSVFVGLLSTQRTESQEGDTTYYDGVITDITERKRRERELVEAKEEAEEAARLKSAMMANMSHEVRTPLTSIIGFTEMMKENLEGQMQVFAEKAHQGSQRLMETLDSILELSRLEAGGYDFDREEMDLRALVCEAPELVDPSAKEKLAGFDTEVPERPVSVYVSRAALRRVLENLVGNAVKFTPEGGRVTVRTWSEDERVALEVEDTGIGMDPGEVEELFEAFKQASQGLDREYEGSGLGLSIVRRLAEAHGGSVEVETEKGEGSRFTVWLPAGGEPPNETGEEP